MKIKSSYIESHVIKFINNDIFFLMLKRAEDEMFAGVWQPVTGTIDENEKAFETARREINEEIGVKIHSLFVIPFVNPFYLYRLDEINFVPVFVAQISERDEIKISNEHSDFKWMSPEEAKAVVAWEGQRKSIDIIVDYFTSKNNSLIFEKINFDYNK